MKFYSYIDKDHVRKGPLPLDGLSPDEITPDTPVWCEDISKWKKAKDVEELSTFLKFNLREETKNNENEKVSVLLKNGQSASLNSMPSHTKETTQKKGGIVSSQSTSNKNRNNLLFLLLYDLLNFS